MTEPSRMKWVKRVVSWIVVLSLAGAAGYAGLQYRQQNAVAEPKFRTVKIEKANIAAKVTATGTLSARVTVQVGAQVSGRILELFVDFNSQVKKGQVIGKLDPLLFQAALARAQASATQAKGQLDKAKVNLMQAQRTLDRAVKMRADGLAGDADVETAQAAVDAARSDVSVANGAVAQAAASLNEAQVNLGFTTITSPIDGVVLTRAVDVGQTVAASLSAPTLFTIAQELKNIQVDTYDIKEADVRQAAQRDGRLDFTVDAYPGQKFKGVIRDVRNAS
ncbi:MAG: efflux RND transporter periplasmic adaptor subunit [Polyangiaceae bacterium]